jgi:hypothetical protein
LRYCRRQPLLAVQHRGEFGPSYPLSVLPDQIALLNAQARSP